MTLPLFTGGAAVERPGVCRICGRTLKNPESARIGIGPVCAGKASSSSTQEDSMHRGNNVRAKFKLLGEVTE